MKSKKLLAVMTGIVILALATTVLADENSWSTNGPYGASVQSIAIHPFNDQQIYIATTSGGIWQTTNGGADWSKIENDLIDNAGGIRVIKIDPLTPDTIYAATNRGVFKTIDAGQSWERLPLPCDYCEYSTLEVNPENPSIIYVQNFRSTDGGMTWQTVLYHYPYDIKADQQNPNVVYAATGTETQSVLKSTNYGQTWYNIHNNLPNLEWSRSRTIDIDPADSQIIYLGRDNFFVEPPLEGQYLFKSIDGGESWTDISPPPLSMPAIVDVAVSPLDPNTIFACSDMDGVFRSTDAGQTWEPANQGTINYRPKTVAFNNSGTAYLGFYFDGIYNSTNNGDTWEKISNNISLAFCYDIAANWLNPDTLYTPTTHALYMSSDGARSWEYVDINLPDPNYDLADIEVDPYDPNYIYAAYYYRYPNDPWSPSGLARSTDGGSTWEFLTNGLPQDRNYYHLSVADYYGGGARRLYLGSVAGLFYSDDLGESWSLCEGGLPSNINVFDVKVSPVDPDIVIVSNRVSWNEYNLWKSTDGGQTWEGIRNNLPQGDYEYVSEISCDPVDPDIIYVSLEDQRGLYKSTDGGQTWTNTNNNLPRGSYFTVSGIAINPQNNNNVFVHSYDRGMFQSHDGGQTWEDFNEGLRIGGYATTTLIDPINTDRLFLSMYGNSVWEHTITEGGPCGNYVVGDYNGNGIFNIADVIEAYSKLKTSSPAYPELDCDCLGDGNEWAVRMDVNGSCTFNIADVVAAYSNLKTGSPELVPCDQCPPDPNPSPGLLLETEDLTVDKKILKELDKLLRSSLK